MLHPQARRHLVIVVAQQMQDAMNEVAQQFRLPRRAKPPCLAKCLLHAHADFPVQPGGGMHRTGAGVRIVEGDDIRHARVPQVGFVQPRDLG